MFLGRVVTEPQANATEIAAMRYVSADGLETEFRESPEAFTPWFKLEWNRLREAYPQELSRYLAAG